MHSAMACARHRVPVLLQAYVARIRRRLLPWPHDCICMWRERRMWVDMGDDIWSCIHQQRDTEDSYGRLVRKIDSNARGVSATGVHVTTGIDLESQ